MKRALVYKWRHWQMYSNYYLERGFWYLSAYSYTEKMLALLLNLQRVYTSALRSKTVNLT